MKTKPKLPAFLILAYKELFGEWKHEEDMGVMRFRIENTVILVRGCRDLYDWGR